MWHDEPEVVAFLRRAHQQCPTPRVVVEAGSYVMHDHDPRPLWPGSTWIGVDSRPGPGVDRVGLAHVVLADVDADLALSISALEHDPYWQQTIRALARCVTRRHGVLAITCPGPEWPEHELEISPTPGYYRGLTPEDLREAVVAGYGPVPGELILSSWTDRHAHGPRHSVLARLR